ncbi:MAG: sodium:calcium antiporter [Armatimonadetes bacterium]|nr:sodium:calcium antiporter [Armatimonadota bacterium]
MKTIPGWVWILGAAVVGIPWIFLRLSGTHPDHLTTTILSGLAIVSAAFLLSWVSEVAQLDIPRSLAFVIVALVAILPEYAVDVYFAWKAGTDPVYVAYATANMTGANRLLLGLGWSLIVCLAAWKYRTRVVVLDRNLRVEIAFLTMAAIYAFTLPLKGTIHWVDTVILILLFGGYAWVAFRAEVVEPEIVGPAETLAALPVPLRRASLIFLFLYAAAAILLSSEPFAEGLVHVGQAMGVDEFLLVQWIAPLASETPEFLMACVFVLRNHAIAAIGTLVSSKVNQWTLLVGILPIAYSIGAGKLLPLPLDARQVEEVFLTAAQTAFAVVLIADLKITVWNAVALFGLFFIQTIVPSTEVRLLIAWVYIAWAAIILIFFSKQRAAFRAVFQEFPIWLGFRRRPPMKPFPAKQEESADR